jgi:MFS family permease
MPSSMRAVFRATPEAVPMAAWSLVGRFGFAMTNVGLLLNVSARTGSYGIAGALSAASLVGTAVGMVGQGRLVDRYGPTRPLLVLGALYVGLGGISIAGIAANLPPVVLGVLILAACVVLPAVSVASRTMWPHLVPSGELRDAAYGYEAISFELCWLLGPAAAALLATLVWPGAGLLGAVVLASVGAGGFALTAAVRSRRGGPRVRADAAKPGPDQAGLDRAGFDRAGFDRGGFATLLVAASGFGWAIASVVVAVIAGTEAYGVPQASGVLLAVLSASSIAGGLLYQRWAWAGRRSTRLPILMVVFGLVLFVPVLLDGVAALSAMIVLGGLTLVPQITAHNTLLDGLVPAARLTEAYGMVATTIAVANAAGQAMAGILVDRYDHQASLIAGGACTLSLAAVVWAYRRTLGGPPPMKRHR